MHRADWHLVNHFVEQNVVIFVTTTLRMFMEFYISMNIIKKMKSKYFVC